MQVFSWAMGSVILKDEELLTSLLCVHQCCSRVCVPLFNRPLPLDSSRSSLSAALLRTYSRLANRACSDK